MPFPESVDDPRPDVRPPTYSKGQWFGPVPRTRVYLAVSSAGGVFSFLANGVVLQNNQFPEDTPPTDIAVWNGYVHVDDVVVRCFYNSPIQANFLGDGYGLASFGRTTTPTGTAVYQVSETPWTPGVSHALPLIVNNTGQSFGTQCLVVMVPEWSRPSEYWPDVTISDVSA